MRIYSGVLALAAFGCYVALFPGSTMTVVLGAVPAWGAGLGGLLLLLQGLAVAAWLGWRYGLRGLLAGAATLAIAWVAEHVGETSGWPFGRYSYTELLQPQLGGVVPVPIVCAWLMVAVGAWQTASVLVSRMPLRNRGAVAGRIAMSAALVLALDLQIETVATRVNSYWIWADTGPYYGVPTANFLAWWLIGGGMAAVLDVALRRAGYTIAPLVPTRRWNWQRRVLERIPALLYVLSTLMFAVINLAYGYALAGIVGIALLMALAWFGLPLLLRVAADAGVAAGRQTSG